MTSKSSFFNLLKEDLRRRLWTVILAALVFFGTFVVAFTMVLQNSYDSFSKAYTNSAYAERISAFLCNNFYGFYPWFMLVAIVGAVICAMSGFAYLHSRKQMDFYHSLPVKRETLFLVRFLNGIFIYAVPYLIGLLYTYLLCIIYGVMTTEILACSLFFFLIHLMGYLIMYLVGILAMMLTGKLLLGFLGLAVLNVYVPAMVGLFEVLKSSFFITNYGTGADFQEIMMGTRWLSPASYYICLIMKLDNETVNFFLEFVCFLLLAAVLFGINLWLYKLRASEKADTAMAFKITEPIVRIMITIPVGTLAGVLFLMLQYDNGRSSSVLWLVFGSVLGAVLCHGVIEALYSGDIRKCLAHKGQLLLSVAVTVFLPLAFLYDFFGYDTYLPKKNEIASVALVNRDLRFEGSYYDENGWNSSLRYALDNMELTDIDAVYELAEFLTSEVEKNRMQSLFNGSYISGMETGGKVSYTDFVIQYTLKNGSQVSRYYECNYYSVLDLLERIYNNEEYKTAVNPVFGLLKYGYTPTGITCYAPTNGTTVKLVKNCQAILETYRDELLAMDFDELKNSCAIGQLEVDFEVGNGTDTYEGSSILLVYPSMTKTLALLKEQGYRMQGIEEAANILKITVSYDCHTTTLREYLNTAAESGFDSTSVEESAEVYAKYPEITPAATETVVDSKAENYWTEGTIEITDPAEIAELQKNLVCRKYVSEFGEFPEVAEYLYVEVEFGANGSSELDGMFTWTNTFRFRKDSVPEFLIERILE